MCEWIWLSIFNQLGIGGICAKYKICPSSGRRKTRRVNQYITRWSVTKPRARPKQPREKELPLVAGHNATLPPSLDSFNDRHANINPASRAQFLASPASQGTVKSRIPSIYLSFSRFPHRILVKSRIPKIPFQTLSPSLLLKTVPTFFVNYLYLFSKVISCNNQFSCQQNTWR